MSESKVLLKNVRLSFPKLFKPQASVEGGDLKYSAAFLIDPSTEEGAANLKKVEAAIAATKSAKWGAKVPKMKHEALSDGNEKDYDGYKDVMVVGAADQRPPVLIDRDRSPLNEATCMSENKLYPGCYVNAVVLFWAYDNKFGKGMGANLKAVQFADHGEDLSGATTIDVDSEFDDLDGDDL